MSTIIVGHFDRAEQVQVAASELARRDFQPGEYASYRLQPGLGLFTLGEPGSGGPLVAVCVDRPGTEAAAILILSRCGAREMERTAGEWRNGTWRDYDPEAPREILKEIPGDRKLPDRG